jgi:hypothetical protein
MRNTCAVSFIIESTLINGAGLRYFASVIGDYDSLLIMLPRPPEPFCPSMQPKTIDLFVRFKMQAKDTVLLDDDGEIVKDVLGEPVLCQGTWKHPRNVDQCLMAVQACHRARNQVGAFVDVCKQCVELDQAGDANRQLGCKYHRGKPNLWRRGSPKESQLLGDRLKQVSKDCSEYQESGDSALTPFELMDMRSKMISSNKLWDLQFWVMTIIACRLFLRSDELCDLKYTSEKNENCLNWDVTIIRPDGRVEAIGFNIKGKTDSRSVALLLWSDDDNPALCPVRALMVYMHFARIKSGYLFPSREGLKTLAKDDSDGEAMAPMRYENYQNMYKTTCAQLINRPGPWGTHSNRKTAYLLATWGGGAEGEIILSARHKSIQTALPYKRSNAALLKIAEANMLATSVVSKWKPAYCADLQMASSLNIRQHHHKFTLFTLADTFVTNHLMIPSDHVRHTIPIVFQAAVDHQQASNVRDSIKAIMGALEPGMASQLESLIEQYALEKRNQMVIPPTGSAQPGILADNDIGPPPAKKSKRGGSNDLVKRHEIRLLKTIGEKLDLLLQIEIPEESSEMTEAARNWVQQQCRPVLNCLSKHFLNDKEKFFDKWTKFNLSTFKKKCCDGGETCFGIAIE